MKAKYFLIKQNPFTKYKFCKKKRGEGSRDRGERGKKKMSRTENAEAYTAQMALKLTGNLTRKWSMLEHTVLPAQGLGSEEDAPTGLFQRARLSHLPWGTRAQRCGSTGTAGGGSAGHLLLLPARAGREETLKNLSLSANKSMQIRLQGKPAPSPSPRAARRGRGRADSSGPQENHRGAAAFQRGRRP